MKIIYCILKDKSVSHQMYKDCNLDWLHASIKHNATHHKNDEFIIITDYDNLKFNDKNIILHNACDYLNVDIQWFIKNYIHLSTNYLEFEKNCIIRYMLLHSFCEKNNIKEFLHLEADVVLFTESIQDDLNYFKNAGCGLTLLKQMGAGGCFFDLNVFNSLQLFNKYVLNTYDSNILKIPKCFNMEKQKSYHQESIDKKLMRGGVSDMHFWNYIYHTNKSKCFGNMEIPVDDVLWHHCVQNPDNKLFEDVPITFCGSNHKILKLQINDNECFAFRDGNKIKLKMLHFHGAWKQKIIEFINN